MSDDMTTWDEDGTTRHDFVDSMRTRIMVAAAEPESLSLIGRPSSSVHGPGHCCIIGLQSQ